jgi:hypothetical protein
MSVQADNNCQSGPDPAPVSTLNKCNKSMLCNSL